MTSVSASYLTRRQKTLTHFLALHHIEAVLLTSISSILYFTGIDLFSKEEREAYILMTSSHIHVITDTRYTDAVTQLFPAYRLHQRTHTTPLSTIIGDVINNEKITRIGFEEDSLLQKEYATMQKYIPSFTPVSLQKLRAQKDTVEIEMIEKACAIGDEAFSFLTTHIALGMTEQAVCFRLKQFIREQGADISFEPIIAFGQHTAHPHHTPTTMPLTNNTPILLDFGVLYHNYCSDMTRMLYMGSISSEQEQMHTITKQAQDNAYKTLSKTTNAARIDLAARSVMSNHGYPTIPHATGHGIGLSVHESPIIGPNSKDTLVTQSVFTLEPGIYLPHKYGIRLEDMYVKQKEVKKLTRSSQEIIVL